jgi:predicted small lipoprotein YifL
MMKRTLPTLVLVTLAAASLTLAGCGRRGPLEPPPGAPDARRAEAAQGGQAVNQPAANTGFGPQINPEADPANQVPDGLPPRPATPETIRLDAPGIQGAPPQLAGRPAPTGPDVRRSPPPRTPFILDPLL